MPNRGDMFFCLSYMKREVLVIYNKDVQCLSINPLQATLTKKMNMIFSCLLY